MKSVDSQQVWFNFSLYYFVFHLKKNAKTEAFNLKLLTAAHAVIVAWFAAYDQSMKLVDTWN